MYQIQLHKFAQSTLDGNKHSGWDFTKTFFSNSIYTKQALSGIQTIVY